MASSLAAGLAWGHGVGTLGAHVLDWRTETVSRIVSPAYSFNDLGTRVVAAAGELVEVDGDTCLRGHQFNLDVNNEYAFDIDEAVKLTLELDSGSSGPDILVAYDRKNGPGQIHVLRPESGNARDVVSLTLPDARFADRGDFATDIKIAGQPGLDNFTAGPPGADLTLCDVTIERSYETAPPAESGWLDLTVLDETGAPAAIRAGIYDGEGRSALPSADAIAIKKFADRRRDFLLGSHIAWPVGNRFVFYLDGSYHVRLPAGRHRLVGTRGIEYRMVDETLDIQAGQTLSRTVTLKRFADLPTAGWYAGDVHIHSARRDDRDGIEMLRQATAEDLNVGNILNMDNIAAVHFPQRGWGRAEGRVQAGAHAIVSGQEGRRTSHRGHLIHLNIERPLHFPERYLQYHEVLEAVADQGGISGYGHVAYGGSATFAGLLLDVPFGLVDFVEVAQGGITGTYQWFTLLNLGYRISPAAGTDYPYLDHPGAHRSYVHMEGGYSVDGWFDGLRDGHTYVTNGPLLSFEVNGRGMGEELRVGRGDVLSIVASARLNPDIDSLARLELVAQGEVIASAEAGEDGVRIDLEHDMEVTDGTWLVIRAVGSRAGPGTIAALSAPVYVVVDDDARTRKRAAVPGLVAELTARLDALAGLKLDATFQNELWETGPVWDRVWDEQMRELGKRIEAAKAELRALAEEAGRGNPGE